MGLEVWIENKYIKFESLYLQMVRLIPTSANLIYSYIFTELR